MCNYLRLKNSVNSKQTLVYHCQLGLQNNFMDSEVIFFEI